MKQPLIPLVVSYILGILIGQGYPSRLVLLLFSYLGGGFLLYFILCKFLPPPRKVAPLLLFLFLPLVSGQAYMTFLSIYGQYYPTNHLKNLSFPYRLDLEGRLYPPKGFRNFYGFDYQKYMAQKGIYALGWVKEGSRIEVVDREGGNYIFRGIAQLKTRMLSFVERYSPQPQGAILKAMVLGDKGFLDRSTKQLFRDAGIAHLLVVSGLHVGFVALAFI